MDFSKIQFGLKSAEAERRRDPDLLLEGFFNKNGAIARLVDGDACFVLGYKGSGKSAIAEHLSLTSGSDPMSFVATTPLRDFPFDQIPLIVSDRGDATVRTNLGWSIVLLLKLLESLSQDQGLTNDGDLQRVYADLRAVGLLPKRRLRDLVLASREINLTATLSEILKAELKQTYKEPILILTQARDIIRDMVISSRTDSKHILIIDGLDEIFTNFASSYLTLASLVHAVDALNADLSEAPYCAKVILLCRTDLFDRLPSANTNKLRDYAVELDWYSNPNRPQHSDLFKLATRRARLAGYSGTDVVSQYLPEKITRGLGLRARWRGGAGEQALDTYKFVLDHTRHTPRDFFQVLHYIQRQVRRNNVTSDRVFDGLREYSINYFLPEVQDELAGYFTPDQVQNVLQVIGGLRKREFRQADLVEYATSHHKSMDLDWLEVLRVLFDCSVVGNVVAKPGGGRYYTFRFRNRAAAPNPDEMFILHRGLWKALNLT